MRLLPACLVVLLSVACADDPVHEGAGPVDPDEETGALPSAIAEFRLPAPASGVSRGDHSLWFLVPQVGLVETTLEGQERGRIPWQTNGLVDYGFTDLAVLEGGTFALTGNQEVWHYRPDVGALESWFCFIPVEEMDVQENQAITYDPRTALLRVAPARWNASGSELALSWVRLETYRAADASFYSTLDVTPTGVISHGLAWDLEAHATWSVTGNSLHRFSDTGLLEATLPLEGVTDAQGIVVDGTNLAILDATGDVRLIPRPTL